MEKDRHRKEQSSVSLGRTEHASYESIITILILGMTKVSKMTQWVKELATKTGALSLIPGIHTVEGKN